MSKDAKTLGVDNLVRFIESIFAHRDAMLAALAELDVLERYGFAPNGQPSDTDYIREHWEQVRHAYATCRGVLEEALRGRPPTRDTLLSSPAYNPDTTRLFVADLANLFQALPALIEKGRKEGIQLAESVSDDEYRRRIAEIHLRIVTERDRTFRPEWEEVKLLVSERGPSHRGR